jgi:prevent-host-death family protein
MVEEIPVTQARADFAELVNRVVYGDERIVVTRHGKPIVALVPAADLARLDALDAVGAVDPPVSVETERDGGPGRLVRLPSRPINVAAKSAAPYEVAAEHRSRGRGSTERR